MGAAPQASPHYGMTSIADGMVSGMGRHGEAWEGEADLSWVAVLVLIAFSCTRGGYKLQQP